MSRQNRDTWQIWARIPVIIISILGNIVLSDFYIGLAQFRRPYVPIFRSFSYKNAGFKSKKITLNEANTKSGNPRKRGEFSCLNDINYPDDIYYAPYNIGLCMAVYLSEKPPHASLLPRSCLTVPMPTCTTKHKEIITS